MLNPMCSVVSKGHIFGWGGWCLCCLPEGEIWEPQFNICLLFPLLWKGRAGRAVDETAGLAHWREGAGLYLIPAAARLSPSAQCPGCSWRWPRRRDRPRERWCGFARFPNCRCRLLLQKTIQSIRPSCKMTCIFKTHTGWTAALSVQHNVPAMLYIKDWLHQLCTD